ncbi:MAG: hypothetical protein D6696_17780 [Acidobacteria bacterium]|nr:MAG: hypothetical protein D6696_17780 [Acidobacteriota bacterium]
MIRINLLQEGRRPVVARRAKAKLTLGRQDPSLLILIAGIVIGSLVSTYLWYTLKTRIDEKDEQIAQAEIEVRELQKILDKVEQFKADKADLETKIAVIQDLKRKQKGPVQVMDRISRALPDLLWLESMQLQGQTVTLRGQALNTNAVAAFIANLNKVPEFHEPDTKDVRAVGRGGREAYAFNLVFTFIQQTEDEAAEDAGATAAGP